MKRILTFISVFALLLTACEGPQGPPGPPGFNGQDGESALAFEILNANFTAPNFEVVQNFEILSSDVVLVYRQTNPLDTNEPPIWQLLPQTYFIDADGNDLVYNYDFTQFDLIIFLDSSLEPTALDAQWTDNQNFRVVVLPTIDLSTIDTSDIDVVMQFFNIENFELL